MYRRRFDEAIATFAKAFEGKTPPPLRVADNKAWLGDLNRLAGRESEGRALLEEARRELLALREKGETSRHLSEALLWTAASLGDRQAVEREAEAILARAQRDLWRAPGAKEILAGAYCLLGDADRALPLLEQALTSVYHHSITPAKLRLDPLWDRIRNDPRFQKLSGKNRRNESARVFRGAEDGETACSRSRVAHAVVAADDALRVTVDRTPRRESPVSDCEGSRLPQRWSPREFFGWLEGAYAEQYPRVINTAAEELRQPYSAGPRFAAFCRKVGHPVKT